MIMSRFMPGFAASAAICFAIAAPTNSLQAALKANSAKSGHHLDHLHQAAHELKHAHAAVSGKGGKTGANAGKHVSAAIGRIEAAIQHHKKHLQQSRTGVTGAIATVAHHHHHSQLHEALHAAKAAEKHIESGNTKKAASEISNAHHHVELAMHSHHNLIGK